jgi:hypothetical protein
MPVTVLPDLVYGREIPVKKGVDTVGIKPFAIWDRESGWTFPPEQRDDARRFFLSLYRAIRRAARDQKA